MKISKVSSIGFAAIFASAILFGFSSCESQPDDSKEVAEEQNEVTFDDKGAEKDADRLVDAASLLQKNVKLGELAASKASSKAVKDLGSSLAKTHAADLTELGTLASAKAISLPAATTENTLDAYEDLNDKSGMDFDKLYCDKVVSSHKDAIDKMESIANNAEDTEIRDWASKMLPHLRSHLTAAETVQKSLNDMK